MRDQVNGCPFFWFVFFRQVKKMNNNKFLKQNEIKELLLIYHRTTHIALLDLANQTEGLSGIITDCR